MPGSMWVWPYCVGFLPRDSFEGADDVRALNSLAACLCIVRAQCAAANMGKLLAHQLSPFVPGMFVFRLYIAPSRLEHAP